MLSSSTFSEHINLYQQNVHNCKIANKSNCENILFSSLPTRQPHCQSSHPLTCRPLSWIQSQDMGAFLSIAKGSSESPWLLEVHYGGTESREDKQPIVLVGKGVWDSKLYVGMLMVFLNEILYLLFHSSNTVVHLSAVVHDPSPSPSP